MDRALKNKLLDEVYEMTKRIYTWDLSTMNPTFNPEKRNPKMIEIIKLSDALTAKGMTEHDDELFKVVVLPKEQHA